MRKFYFAVASTFLLLSLTACSDDPEATPSKEKSSNLKEEIVEVVEEKYQRCYLLVQLHIRPRGRAWSSRARQQTQLF